MSRDTPLTPSVKPADEEAMRAVITAWDNLATTEPCRDCLRDGTSLLSPLDEGRMDHAVDRLREVLVERAEPPTRPCPCDDCAWEREHR